jgi:uncharacterized membrane protein YhaH (DUF805 family)
MDRFVFVWLHFNGRIGRLTWLGFALLISILELVTENLLRRAFHWPAPMRVAGDPLSSYPGDEISLLASLIFLWPSAAIDVKRWHDIGLSGWLVLVIYLPAFAMSGFALSRGAAAHTPDPRVAGLLYGFGLAALVYFIILAARRGEPGKNRYGPPPE